MLYCHYLFVYLHHSLRVMDYVLSIFEFLAPLHIKPLNIFVLCGHQGKGQLETKSYFVHNQLMSRKISIHAMREVFG